MAEHVYNVHQIDEFVFRFPDGFFLEGIRWYGLAYVAGFVCAALLLTWYHRKKRSTLDFDARSNLMTAIIIGALAGGRLGYVFFYEPEIIFSDPLKIFKVWEGGMASHGGFIGVAVAVYWYSRKMKLSFLRIGDMVCTLAPPGLFFGRIANFINGELWGRITDAPYAWIFPKAQFGSTNGEPNFNALEHTVHVTFQYAGQTFQQLANPRHPSQLYEAALEGLVLFIFIQWRFWKFPNLAKGRLAGEFLCAYAALRIVGEAYRQPDAELILGLSRGTFYSLFMILCGIIVIGYARRLEHRNLGDAC